MSVPRRADVGLLADRVHLAKVLTVQEDIPEERVEEERRDGRRRLLRGV